MKVLLWMMIATSLGAPACGGKKAQPPAAPVANESAGSADTAGTAGSGAEGSATTGSGGGTASSCEAEGGKCISKVAAVGCGTKSHDGGCPDNGYCCIR